jgi:hypothetical protein
VPPVADQVTAVLLEPVTVALNCFVPPGVSEADVGLIEIATAVGTVTVTAADADFVGSAALFAVTVYVPAVLGAVYRPEVDTLPPVAAQVTAVLLEPLTVAVNCLVPPVVSEAEVGLTDTETGAITVIVAEADLVGSAALVAVTL